MTNRFSNRITGCTVLAVAVLGLVPATAFAAGAAGSSVPMSTGNNGNPAVMPVNSKPFGLTYGEWSARFWQWEFSLPVTGHPLFDTADCSAGQSGPVWFLGGTFVNNNEIHPGVVLGKETRSCAIPAGKALFFPIVNTECSTAEGNGTTEAELRACAEFFDQFIVTNTLSASLDGVPINALGNYNVESPLFTFGPLPNNNILQFFGINALAGTTSPSVSDGVHLMLHPLSAGTHVLHFYGELDLRSIGSFEFIQDITYYLTVTP